MGHGHWYNADNTLVSYVDGHYYPGHGYWRHGHWYTQDNALISYVDGHYYPGHGYWRHGRWYNDNGEQIDSADKNEASDAIYSYGVSHPGYGDHYGPDGYYYGLGGGAGHHTVVHQDEPHVEFDHDHEHGPVGYEPAQYIPAHTQRGYHQIHHFCSDVHVSTKPPS